MSSRRGARAGGAGARERKGGRDGEVRFTECSNALTHHTAICTACCTKHAIAMAACPAHTAIASCIAAASHSATMKVRRRPQELSTTREDSSAPGMPPRFVIR